MLTSIWKKTIATSSPRLQRLLLRLAQYDVHIEYLRGKENVIADALSRVTSIKSEHTDCSDSLSNIEKYRCTKSHKQHLPDQRDYKNCEKLLKGIHH